MNTTHPDSAGGPNRDTSAKEGPEEIEAAIGRTREQLDGTLGELGSRLSPTRRLREAADSARRFGARTVRAATSSVTPSITTMIRLDHTHVLALFRRLRPGTSARRKQAIVTNACLALEVHAQLEEEIFYPALREVLDSSEILDKSKPEHDQMRELIRILRGNAVTDPDYDSIVCSLMRTVLHHVADEESVLLPRAEIHLQERLAELGARMTRRRVQLLRPNLGEVVTTTALSFPWATAALTAGMLALGWRLLRPRGAVE
jgi:hemerythrin superfamily protein